MSLVNSYGSLFSSNSQFIQQDPDSYAQTYAAQNGLTLDEAKAELKSKYGDPAQGAPLFGTNNGVTNSITTSGSDDDEYRAMFDEITAGFENAPDPSIDPDEYLSWYADFNGISTEDAKAELQEQFGNPQRPDLR